MQQFVCAEWIQTIDSPASSWIHPSINWLFYRSCPKQLLTYAVPYRTTCYLRVCHTHPASFEDVYFKKNQLTNFLITILVVRRKEPNRWVGHHLKLPTDGVVLVPWAVQCGHLHLPIPSQDIARQLLPDWGVTPAKAAVRVVELHQRCVRLSVHLRLQVCSIQRDDRIVAIIQPGIFVLAGHGTIGLSFQQVLLVQAHTRAIGSVGHQQQQQLDQTTHHYQLRRRHLERRRLADLLIHLVTPTVGFISVILATRQFTYWSQLKQRKARQCKLHTTILANTFCTAAFSTTDVPSATTRTRRTWHCGIPKQQERRRRKPFVIVRFELAGLLFACKST